MAERNFETLLNYDSALNGPFPSPSPSTIPSHKLNLVQLEIIEEEKKDGVTGRDIPDEDNTSKAASLIGKVRKAFKGVVNFSINTAMCRSELELIQHVIDINGFGESQSNAALGNLVWYGLALH